MRIDERVWRYAERYFQRSGKEKFPTVARVARGLRITQSEVEQACEDSEYLMLTSYHVVPTPALGEYFVETFEK